MNINTNQQSNKALPISKIPTSLKGTQNFGFFSPSLAMNQMFSETQYFTFISNLKCKPNDSDILELLRPIDNLDFMDEQVSQKNKDRNISQPDSNSQRLSSRGKSGKPVESNDKRWQKRYADLLRFKQRFGHCHVPSQWNEDASLAQWVKRQRYQLRLREEGRHSTMSRERERLLNAIDFSWDPHTSFWEDRLRELALFKEEHGHGCVPTKYPENPQLAIWAKVCIVLFGYLLVGIAHLQRLTANS